MKEKNQASVVTMKKQQNTNTTMLQKLCFRFQVNSYTNQKRLIYCTSHSFVIFIITDLLMGETWSSFLLFLCLYAQVRLFPSHIKQKSQSFHKSVTLIKLVPQILVVPVYIFYSDVRQYFLENLPVTEKGIKRDSERTK